MSISANESSQYRERFMGKLPNEYLFTVKDLNSGWCGGEPSWFSFLQGADDACGRAENSAGSVRREFHYIRYGQDSFLRLMAKHVTPQTKSFLDIGCGGGDKLQLMRDHFPHLELVDGIEHDPAMAIWARTIEGVNVLCADALKCRKVYGSYDIIYAYWPISNDARMNRLIDMVLAHKQERAKFILVGFRLETTDSRKGKIVLA